jgi:hypothetical protein
VQKDIAMKPTNLLLIVSFGLALLVFVSTARSNTIDNSRPALPTQEDNNPTNSIYVILYSDGQKPEKPYVILSQDTVSKYNSVGIKRQKANLNDSIRDLAAKKGGDAVIEVKNTPDSITYTVISYRNSMNDAITTDKA